MSLRPNELENTLEKTLHIDEYRAKMGSDDDVMVLSLKSKYRDQAYDLVNFLEVGYDWVLDADVSAGELQDGSYLVFIEIERRPSAPEKILKMLSDLKNVTNIDASEFEFAYHKEHDYHPVNHENLEKLVPLTPREYRAKNGKSLEDMALESMQMAAGLAPKTEKVTDPELKAFVNLSK